MKNDFKVNIKTLINKQSAYKTFYIDLNLGNWLAYSVEMDILVANRFSSRKLFM